MNGFIVIVLAILIEVIAIKHLNSAWDKCKDLGCKAWIKTALEILILLGIVGVTIYGFASLHGKATAGL